MRARGLLLLTLGALFALVGLDVASADPTFVGRGIQRVLINGTRTPAGVSEIQCKSDAGACYRDAGVVTFDFDQVGAGSVPNPVMTSVTNIDPGIRLGAIDGGTSGRTVVAARLPQRVTVVGSAQSTSAAAVAYAAVTVPEVGSGFVEQYCVGQQTTYVDAGGAADGGAFIDGSVYVRYTPFRWNGTAIATFGGGNVTPLEREDISTWSGPSINFVTDGGTGAPVLSLQTTSGVAATTVDWLCRGEVMLIPERDAGF